MITQGVNLLIIAPINGTALSSQLNNAGNANITVIEFLSEDSLVSLRLLDSSTCVGLRYGRLSPLGTPAFLARAFTKIVTPKNHFHSLCLPARLDG